MNAGRQLCPESEEKPMRKIKNLFSARERRELQLPEEIYGSGPFIELHGRREVCVQGCRKILLCEPDAVRLALREGILSVRGRGLSCTAYFAGAVSVRGVICAVFFEDGGETVL